MTDLKSFAASLKRCRRERKLSQAEVADLVGVTPQSVSRWECGDSVPDIAHLTDLSEILGVSLDALLLNRSPEVRCLVGVDAGGTKTEFVLADETGRPLRRTVLEGANPSVSGIEETIRIVRRGLNFLKPDEMNVSAVWVGGAGLSVGNNADVLRSALEKSFPGIRIGCANDAMNVLACASDPERCIAVISGTSSVVFSSYRGTVTRFGGAGYLFEQYGGGFEIGRSAVSAAIRDREGTGEKTLLTALVEEKLNGTVWSRMQDLYRQDVSYIASFAPLVSEAAGQKDALALRILYENADHLSDLILEALRRHPRIQNVLYSGSTILNSPVFRERITSRLPDNLTITLLDHSPVFGALVRAARLAGLPKPSLEAFLTGNPN